jgi:hypothetical protein
MPNPGYDSLTVPEIIVTALEEWREKQKKQGNMAYASPTQIVIRLVIEFLKEQGQLTPQLAEIERDIIRAAQKSKP